MGSPFWPFSYWSACGSIDADKEPFALERLEKAEQFLVEHLGGVEIAGMAGAGNDRRPR